MNNKDLLNYCTLNPEQPLDRSYMYIENHEELDKYVSETKKLKLILKKIKELPEAEREASGIYEKLRPRLNKYTSSSEFASFINACDSSWRHVAKNPELLKKIAQLFLVKRQLVEDVSADWTQALLDKTSSRKKGHAGEDKLIELLEGFDYVHTANINEFMKSEKSVSKFREDFTITNIKKNFGESIGNDDQDKKLDLVIKKGDQIYFLEAKHLSNSGGTQNKQMGELIRIVNKESTNKDHHFVSFLDGVYFNLLFKEKIEPEQLDDIEPDPLIADEEELEEETKEEKATKIKRQSKDILEGLSKYPNNYFINTAGFIKLFNT